MSAVAVGLGLATAGVLVATDPAEAQSTVVLGSGNSVLGIAYEDAGFTGAAIIVDSVNPGCTAPITDFDFIISVMPAGWNDEISSAQGLGGGGGFTVCWWKFWADGFNRGPSIGFAQTFSYVGDSFNDEASGAALS
jgi:hypothetical protein